MFYKYAASIFISQKIRTYFPKYGKFPLEILETLFRGFHFTKYKIFFFWKNIRIFLILGLQSLS